MTWAADEIEDVLDALDRHHRRATYGAVAEYIYGNRRAAQSIGWLLDQHSRRTSWVVNAGNNKPTGYMPNDPLLHPNLYDNPDVITTGDELAELMRDD